MTDLRGIGTFSFYRFNIKEVMFIFYNLIYREQKNLLQKHDRPFCILIFIGR